MSVERTVTFSLPKKLDEFFVAYTQLLKYKSVEEFLKEEIEWHLSTENIRNNLDIYFDDNFFDAVTKLYDLEPSYKPKEKVAVAAKP